MSHAVREDLAAALAKTRPGFSLPRSFYVDPEYYRIDLETIHYREWLFAGHDCEINEPGAFFTLQVGDYPVLVIRDRQGELRAFHNMCRHRGSRICTAEKGKVRNLICPYHQWNYDLDGRLQHARHMGADFDKSLYGLKRVACESMGGYIFICVAENPPPFQEFRDLATPYFTPHDLTDAKVAHTETIVEDANWKLVFENNRECYHCAANHPELCRTFPEASAVSGVLGAEAVPEITDHWKRCEAAHLPSRFRMGGHGQFRAVRMPLLEEAESYTMTGKPGVARPLSDRVKERRIGSLLTFHYPTLWNHVLGDMAISFRLLPLGPMKTALTTKWLVHKDAVEGVDYDVKTISEVWSATNDQDRRVSVDNQSGVLSPAYEPGPYSASYEDGVDQFVDWYRGAMTRALAS